MTAHLRISVSLTLTIKNVDLDFLVETTLLRLRQIEITMKRLVWCAFKKDEILIY